MEVEFAGKKKKVLSYIWHVPETLGSFWRRKNNGMGRMEVNVKQKQNTNS